MNSIEREFKERMAVLDRLETGFTELQEAVTRLEGRKKPHRDPNVTKLVDSLLELWSFDTQGAEPAIQRQYSGDIESYRDAIKGWWGEKELAGSIEAAIEEVIVIMCQEQGLEMTYQMVDWLRNKMEFEF